MTPDEESRRERPVMPTADEAGGQRVDAPAVVRVSYWLWLVAGSIGLAAAILMMANREDVVRIGIEANPGLDPAQVRSAIEGLSVWLLVGSAVFLVLFWLLAYKARGGVRKARTLLVVVGVIAAMFQYLGGTFGKLSALLILAALVLLFLPPARRFFAESDAR